MGRYLTMIIWLFLASTSFAQHYYQTKGLLVSEDNKALPDIMVFLLDMDSSILEYSFSDQEGAFVLKYIGWNDSLLLCCKSISHRHYQKIIHPGTLNLNITLVEESIVLREVKIKAESIIRKKDTIEINVASLVEKNDRTIGDVLKKIPGIEILGSGKILYKDEPIIGYTVEGMDATNGRYQIINNNLPPQDISTIQILEQNQPIKVLENVVPSDQAVINLKLKNKFTYTGMVQTAAGATPLLYQSQVTPLVFTPKRQALIQLSANDIAQDLSNVLASNNFNKNLGLIELVGQETKWFDLQRLQTSSFSSERWLDNRSEVASINLLQKMRSEVQYKVHIGYYHDHVGQNGLQRTSYLLPSGLIHFDESVKNRFGKEYLQGSFTLVKNVPKSYISNTLFMRNNKSHDVGVLSLNNNSYKQNISTQNPNLTNDFFWIFPIGKQIVQFRSKTDYHSLEGVFTVDPSFFMAGKRQLVQQDLNTNSFNSKNELFWTKKYTGLTLESSIGIDLGTERLFSQLGQGILGSDSSSFTNKIKTETYDVFTKLIARYKTDHWNITSTLPFVYYKTNLSEVSSATKNRFSLITLEPTVSVHRILSPDWSVSAEGEINNRIGRIEDAFTGFILTDYRNFERKSGILPRTKGMRGELSLIYQNFSSFTYGIINYHINSDKHNTLSQWNFEDGLASQRLIPINNYSSRKQLSMDFKQKLIRLQTGFDLGLNHLVSKYNLSVAGENTPYYSSTKSISFSFHNNSLSWLELSARSGFSWSRISVNNKGFNNISDRRLNVRVIFLLSDNYQIKIHQDYYNSSVLSSSVRSFMDIILRHSVLTKKIDIDLICTNLFNAQTMSYGMYSNLYSQETSFQMRPRQILLRLGLSLSRVPK